MKSEISKPWQADVFPGLSEYLKRKRQLPPSKEGRGYPALGVGMVESLEARRLLSATFNSGTGVLTVTGTVNNDIIYIYQTASDVYVDDNGTIRGPWTNMQVTRVDITCLGGFDIVAIENAAWSPSGDPLQEVVRAFGGDDADNIQGGDLADTIWGDAGDDTVMGYSGNDVLYGGYGGNDESTAATATT